MTVQTACSTADEADVPEIEQAVTRTIEAIGRSSNGCRREPVTPMPVSVVDAYRYFD